MNWLIIVAGQFITNEVSKQSQVKCQNNTHGTTSFTGTNSNNKKKNKNLKVNVEVSQQDDDGIGSLPITPTDLVGKTKSLSLLKKPQSIKCDGDTESVYTSSEEAVTESGRADSDSVSSEDCQDVHSGSSVSRQDKNANVKSWGIILQTLFIFTKTWKNSKQTIKTQKRAPFS